MLENMCDWVVSSIAFGRVDDTVYIAPNLPVSWQLTDTFDDLTLFEAKFIADMACELDRVVLAGVER